MPNLKPVLSLQDLTLLRLAKIVDSVCKNPELRKSELLHTIEYLQQLPKPLQSRICFETIKPLKQKRNKINERHHYTFINLQTCELYHQGFPFPLLFFKELKANHLKRLFLHEPNELYMHPEAEHDRSLLIRPINNFCMSLSNLTEFKTIRICDDYMLEVFSQCCPLLEEIEIIDCNYITNEGISKLCGFSSSLEAKNAINKKDVIPSDKGCRNLKKLVIKSKISSSSIAAAAVLKTCSNLKVLSAAPYEMDTFDGFKILLENELGKDLDSVSQRFTLTALEIFCKDDIEVLPLIVHTCPNITDITIWGSENETKDQILLNHLKKLSIKKLKVKDCNPSSLMWYLKQKGRQIEELGLQHNNLSLPGYSLPGAPLDRSHLQMIISYCPNLSNLILKSTGYSVIDPFISCSVSGTRLYFTSLKEITIDGFLEADDIKILFGRNKLLEKIHVEFMIGNFLDCLLTDGSIKELKSLYYHGELTIEHIRRLLEECPKLETIEPLSLWLISQEEKLKLIEDIKKNNWNLNI